jgi:uncharacterized membrane protein YjgN (DUF898 family)
MDNDNHHSQKTRTTTSYAVIAIVAALAIFGVVAMTVIVAIPQQAEASCVTGYFHSRNQSALFTAFEKSEGRCLHP